MCTFEVGWTRDKNQRKQPAKKSWEEEDGKKRCARPQFQWTDSVKRSFKRKGLDLKDLSDEPEKRRKES